MAINIRLTNAGSSISNTLDIYYSTTGGDPWLPVPGQTGILKSVLLNPGVTFAPPLGATAYRVQDLGSCLTESNVMTCTPATTTTTSTSTSTSTSTTTIAPTTTTTTTSVPTTTTTTTINLEPTIVGSTTLTEAVDKSIQITAFNGSFVNYMNFTVSTCDVGDLNIPLNQVGNTGTLVVACSGPFGSGADPHITVTDSTGIPQAQSYITAGNYSFPLVYIDGSTPITVVFYGDETCP